MTGMLSLTWVELLDLRRTKKNSARAATKAPPSPTPTPTPTLVPSDSPLFPWLLWPTVVAVATAWVVVEEVLKLGVGTVACVVETARLDVVEVAESSLVILK